MAIVMGKVKAIGTRAVRSLRPQAGQGNPVAPDCRAGTPRAGITSPQDGHKLSYKATFASLQENGYFQLIQMSGTTYQEFQEFT